MISDGGIEEKTLEASFSKTVLDLMNYFAILSQVRNAEACKISNRKSRRTAY